MSSNFLSFLQIDNENPVITGCPSDINATTDAGNATARVSWSEPSATDNSGSQTLTPDFSSGSAFPIGNTTVTYTSTDASGNTDNCTFVVTVTGEVCLHMIPLKLGPCWGGMPALFFFCSSGSSSFGGYS